LLEIVVFAVALAVLGRWTDPGGPEDALDLGHFAAFSYSAAAYTSLGGPPLPTPELRLLITVEALTGLILIAWTASFLFVVMEREWGRKS
jgi:hypothetical protein